MKRDLGVRILVVDDDRELAEVYQHVFEGAGYEVSTALSGEAALAIARAERPEVVLTDISMPRMDGFELIARIRASGEPAIREIPAAALTAFARSEDRVRAMRSGFEVHLSKPIEPGELMAAAATLARWKR